MGGDPRGQFVEFEDTARHGGGTGERSGGFVTIRGSNSSNTCPNWTELIVTLFCAVQGFELLYGVARVPSVRMRGRSVGVEPTNRVQGILEGLEAVLCGRWW